MVERRLRSVLKTISWRITATVTTIVISFFVTGNVDLALKIGFVEFLLKIAIGYIHERIWLKIKFGIINPPDYQI